MVDFIILAIVLIMLGAAMIYMIKAKKSGVKCIGCPAGGSCAYKGKNTSCSGCGCSGNENDCSCHTDEK